MTTELLYMCDKVSGVYLSQSALKKLGVIQETFPETTYVASTESTENSTPKANPKLAPCGCPSRTIFPPKPTKMPFPATSDHRIDFEKWIKEYYSISAFNVCPHQKLQFMTGEELKITFKPDIALYAIHNHWKEKKVKAQLDADVALGIIEPIPETMLNLLVSTGFQPPQRIIKAILEFPTPHTVTEVRPWFGLVAQVSYAFLQAPVMSPFRELLSKKTPFYWDDRHSTNYI